MPRQQERAKIAIVSVKPRGKRPERPTLRVEVVLSTKLAKSLHKQLQGWIGKP